ncbi:hypothetical protein IAR50_002165 [Cryptococcus sp. DSM 104548]
MALPLPSPYDTPIYLSTTPLSAHDDIPGDYFSAWNAPQVHHPPPQPAQQEPLPSPIKIHPGPPNVLPSSSTEWQSHAPKASRKTPRNAGTKSGSGSGTKTTRQQFTACSACRHRRVRCDLKDRMEQAEKASRADGKEGLGPDRAKAKVVQCTNCIERALNCVDEFAPLKAAKQLRRGKRIAEIEVLYGKSLSQTNPEPTSPRLRQALPSPVSSLIPTRSTVSQSIPELSHSFFESSFFRRFQVQRPVIDPGNFVRRYRSQAYPTAEAMGPEGAILCHVLYAWAVSYGVDEHGNMDVPDGGGPPLDTINLDERSEQELQREQHREERRIKMKHVIELILREIDQAGLMRKPTWDGVRVLLMILPLTDGISSPVERMMMYEAALSQVYTLCSHMANDYDGRPSATASINGGVADDLEMTTVRVRVYWYSFVHEGITTGLKGGRLTLDDDDLETMQDMVANSALVRDSGAFRISAKFATAPISLALACRKINKALTGTAARRKTAVNGELLKQAWEALETSWEEFDQLLASGGGEHMLSEEVTRFADGWKIFLFEAQNVIYNNLEDRRQKLSNTSATLTARISPSSPSASSSSPEEERTNAALLTNVTHLLDIARSKCELKTRQILGLVRKYVGTTFFEWDASLVRDGTYYAALWMARGMGSGEDVGICLRALNELRWAHAKAVDRSADLRKLWHEHVSSLNSQDVDTVLTNLESLASTDVMDGVAAREPQLDGGQGSSSGGSGQTSASSSSSRVPQYSPYAEQQQQYQNHYAPLPTDGGGHFQPLSQSQGYNQAPYPSEIKHPPLHSLSHSHSHSHAPPNISSTTTSSSPFPSPLIISPYEPSVQMQMHAVYSRTMEEESYDQHEHHHIAQAQYQPQVQMGAMVYGELTPLVGQGRGQYEGMEEGIMDGHGGDGMGMGYGGYKEPYIGQPFAQHVQQHQHQHQHQEPVQGYPLCLPVQQGMLAPDHQHQHQQYLEQDHPLFHGRDIQGLGVQGQFIIQPDGSHVFTTYLHNNQHQ